MSWETAYALLLIGAVLVFGAYGAWKSRGQDDWDDEGGW